MKVHKSDATVEGEKHFLVSNVCVKKFVSLSFPSTQPDILRIQDALGCPCKSLEIGFKSIENLDMCFKRISCTQVLYVF